MSGDPRQISVSTVELVYLAGLLGADGLLGVDDPFPGQMAAEVEEALIRARRSLAGRGMLALAVDRTVAVSDEATGLVRACAQPESSLLITYTVPAEPRRVCCFHLSNEMMVEMRMGPSSESVWVITEINDIAEVTARAQAMLGPGDQAAPPGAPVSLREVDLQVACTAAEAGSEVGEALLAEKGIPAETARCLAEALTNPVANGSVLAMRKGDPEWEVNGFGFLWGAGGIWLMQPKHSGEVALVEMAPVAGPQMQAEVERLTARIWAKALGGMRGEQSG